MQTTCGGRTPTITGTSRGDVIDGTAGDDVILTLGGNDIVQGRGGNDVICGGAGGDALYGDEGDDAIDGGDDRDTLDGGGGNDSILGGGGNDVIHGGDDNDSIDAGTGDDVLYPDAGLDNIVAGPGNDAVFASAGADTVEPGDGRDAVNIQGQTVNPTFDPDNPSIVQAVQDCGGAMPTIIGTPGDDHITGTSGQDVLAGLGGNDYISGGGADDIICGGDGNDYENGGDGSDIMFSGTGDDTVYGGNGPDLEVGGDGRDNLYGQAGNDRIAGSAGDDKVYAGDGDDLVDGGDGGDTVLGDGGYDRCSPENPITNCELSVATYAVPPPLSVTSLSSTGPIIIPATEPAPAAPSASCGQPFTGSVSTYNAHWPQNGRLYGTSLADGQRLIVNEFTWTASQACTDEWKGWALEFDLKLSPDMSLTCPARLLPRPPARTWADGSIDAVDHTVEYNSLSDAAPYVDTSLIDDGCGAVDFSIGIGKPEKLKPGLTYYYTIRVPKGQTSASVVTLLMVRLSRFGLCERLFPDEFCTGLDSNNAGQFVRQQAVGTDPNKTLPGCWTYKPGSPSASCVIPTQSSSQPVPLAGTPNQQGQAGTAFVVDTSRSPWDSVYRKGSPTLDGNRLGILRHGETVYGSCIATGDTIRDFAGWSSALWVRLSSGGFGPVTWLGRTTNGLPVCATAVQDTISPQPATYNPQPPTYNPQPATYNPQNGSTGGTVTLPSVAAWLHGHIVEVHGTLRSVNPSFLVWNGRLYHIGSGTDYGQCLGQARARFGSNAVVHLNWNDVMNWPLDWAANVDRCW